MCTPKAVGLHVTGLSQGPECFYQHSQAVQEEYLTMTMKVLQSVKTSVAIRQTTLVTSQKT